MKKYKKSILICRNMACDDISSLFDERSLRNPKPVLIIVTVNVIMTILSASYIVMKRYVNIYRPNDEFTGQRPKEVQGDRYHEGCRKHKA